MKCDCQSKSHDHKAGECKREAANDNTCSQCAEAEQKAKLPNMDWNLPDEASGKAVKARADVGVKPKSGPIE
jgi:hypothetical protein